MSAHHRPGPLAGLGPVLRHVVRRSRWFYLAWVLPLALLAPATASVYETVVDPRNADVLIATMTHNPTMRAMLGPPFDLTTAGGFTVWRVGTFVAALAGMMTVLGVVRSTRAEEEDGRTELLRSGVLGRHVPLVAPVLVALVACAVLGLLVTVGMVTTGEPTTGSMAFGLGVALVGAVFVGVGALGAQLTGSARTARSLGLWTLAAAYTLRAVADGSADDSAARPLAWASPVQWLALARPYADERWWVLLLPLATTALLLLAVFTVVNVACLVLRRDPVEHEHFRAPTWVPVLGAVTCAYMVGPWTGRATVQYTIAAWVLGVGIVLWALTWFLNRALYARPTRIKDVHDLEDSDELRP